jgi:hypothetical protein
MYLGVCPSLDDGQGKRDSEFSATSDVTLHANISVMFLHVSISNRQSEAGTQRHSAPSPPHALRFSPFASIDAQWFGGIQLFGEDADTTDNKVDR